MAVLVGEKRSFVDRVDGEATASGANLAYHFEIGVGQPGIFQDADRIGIAAER